LVRIENQISTIWLATLDGARAGAYRTTYLDAERLDKHTLGLSKQHPSRERHLVYVYWEPADCDEFYEVRRHRAEVAELLHRVGSTSPRLHALTDDGLWNQWDTVEGVSSLPRHLTALRARYGAALATD
jgi:hypothetical protein